MSHKEINMALYESVIIGRQDLTPNQFEELVEEFIKIIETYKNFLPVLLSSMYTIYQFNKIFIAIF